MANFVHLCGKGCGLISEKLKMQVQRQALPNFCGQSNWLTHSLPQPLAVRSDFCGASDEEYCAFKEGCTTGAYFEGMEELRL
jgi:hypothetical protein